jgi:arylsulfatase A-like enzyme
MDRRQFLLSAAAMAVPERPPNILFIMPDQWRGMDMGCAGNEQVHTPNIDRLAREGIQFTQAVANCPLCTPARSTLLTGKYAHTTRTAVNDVPLPESEETIARILARRGYYTGFVGKWHLEGGKREPGFVPPGPRRFGFEYWAANICSHDYYHQHYFRDDHKPISISGYDAAGWTGLALEFLRDAQSRKKPYCLYVQYPAPHNPYLVPPGFEGMYDPAKLEMRKNWKPGGERRGSAKDIAGYYSAMSCLDREIGRLTAKADENTIVLFTSDHGDMLGSHGTVLKRKPWEESVRVPAVFRLPAGMKYAKTSDASFSHVDVVPTLLGLCGIRPPASMHGFDYSNHLRGQNGRGPNWAHLMTYTKTEDGEFGPWRGLRSREFKYAEFHDRPWVLYDLEKDPYEMHNLVDDMSQSNLMRVLHATIKQKMEETGDKWDELHDAVYR